MNTAPVSVVIPTYNSAELLTQAIDSVLAQTLRPAEIVVVDDGSIDDTRQRLAAYGGLVRYIHQSNQGVSAARNAGVTASRQSFIGFLDADDVWHPRKLELQMPVLEQQPELGLLGARQFDWPGEYPTLGLPSVSRVSWAKLVVKNCLHTSSIVVSRKALDAAGTFDRSIQGPEDRDLWLRVAERFPVANLELPLMGYRDVPGSVSKHAERCEAGMIRILKKIDARGVWAGRWLLRRRAYGFAYHSCSYIHGAAGSYRRGLVCALKSFAWYPLPFHGDEMDVAAERPRRLLVNFLRWVKLKPPELSARPVAG